MEAFIVKKQILNFKMPRYDELPSLDLYLDQVIELVEDSLSDLHLFGDEKFITSSMINNYVKKGIVPVTNKKRYTKEHIASIFMVCIYKQIFSMDEIKNLMDVHIRIVNDESSPIDVKRSYDYFCRELENILVATFENKELPEDTTTSFTSERQLIRNASIAFSNKLYTLHLLQEFNNEEK